MIDFEASENIYFSYRQIFKKPFTDLFYHHRICRQKGGKMKISITRFEPRSSDVENDHSATTTTLTSSCFYLDKYDT